MKYAIFYDGKQSRESFDCLRDAEDYRDFSSHEESYEDLDLHKSMKYYNDDDFNRDGKISRYYNEDEVEIKPIQDISMNLREIRNKLISETLDQTVKAVTKLGYKIKPINGQRFAVLVPRSERMNTINNIQQKLGYIYDPKMKSVSSLGALISKDGILIVVKPDNMQGGNSAGLSNESDLVNTINNFIEQQSPLIVMFRGTNNILEYNNVDQARGVGLNTSGYKKADIQLLSEGQVVANLSLKQDNASVWESADRRYKPIINKLINRLIKKPFTDLGLRESDDDDRIFRFYNPKTNDDYGGVVITDLPSDDNDEIMFGNDVPKTAIISHTFKPSDFTMIDDDVLQIKSGMIFESVADVIGTDDEPVLMVRHDTKYIGSNGLRAVVFKKIRVYTADGVLRGGKKEISYNDL